MKIIYSSQAKRSVDAIYSYVKDNFGTPKAIQAVNEIKSQTVRLSEFKYLGKKFGNNENIRFLPIDKNIVLYEVEENTISILEIYSKGQDWK